MKRQEKYGLVWYESSLLSDIDVRHGFFTSLGGVSKGEFEGLNVQAGIGDNDKDTQTNRCKAVGALSLEEDKLIFLKKLAHNNQSYIVSSDQSGELMDERDALITHDPGLPISLAVADCLPIILAGQGKEFVAVVHAGWRGTVARVASETVNKIAWEFGIKAKNMAAALGPAIQAESYEVGDEVIDAMQQELPEYANDTIIENGAKKHLDIVKANVLQLQDAGVENIDISNIDVFTSSEFYSYRRCKQTGRNLCLASL